MILSSNYDILIEPDLDVRVPCIPCKGSGKIGHICQRNPYALTEVFVTWCSDCDGTGLVESSWPTR